MTDYRFRIIQDGWPVAGGSSTDRAAVEREMSHYAALYAEEGAIRIETRSGKSRWRRFVP